MKKIINELERMKQLINEAELVFHDLLRQWENEPDSEEERQALLDVMEYTLDTIKHPEKLKRWVKRMQAINALMDERVKQGKSENVPDEESEEFHQQVDSYLKNKKQ